MGNFFTNLWNSLGGSRTYKIVIVGLNNAGKTTITYALQLNKFVDTIPTIGGQVEEITYQNIKFLAWDLGGQEQLRESWSLYYASTDAVIFVVDSTEPQRFSIARNELHRILESPDLADACILIFANKQDVAGAIPPEKVAEAMALNAITDRSWTLQGCSAVTSAGLKEGMSWIIEKLQKT